MVKARLIVLLILILFLFQIGFFLKSNYLLSETVRSNENNFVDLPFDLNIGDLLFCDVKADIKNIADTYGLYNIQSLPGYANDHVAMYIGDNKFIEATPYLYAPLRNEWIGVVISPYWLIKIWATNITFGYIKTEQKIRDAAVGWAKTQIGKPYGENGYKCAELIFNSYKKQNVILTFTWFKNNITYDAIIPGLIMRSDQVVMYSNILPLADVSDPFVYSYVDDIVYFNAYNCSDLDGMIVKFIWEFGDGTFTELHPSVGRYVTHVYKKPGEYTIKLTVIDNAGDTDTDITTILIKENNFSDDGDEIDDDMPFQDPSDNIGDENNTIEFLEEDLNLELSMLIATFISIIILIWFIKNK